MKSVRKMSLPEKLDHFSIPEPNSGCLLWTGYDSGGRYGLVGHDSRYTRAHRAAYELAKGPIPAGMHVLHKCDVTWCVNPTHLFLGTHKENMQDRHRKGRYATVARGENGGNSVLSSQDVHFIRESGLPRAELAARLGVNVSTVDRIKKRETWAHL